MFDCTVQTMNAIIAAAITISAIPMAISTGHPPSEPIRVIRPDPWASCAHATFGRNDVSLGGDAPGVAG